MWKSRAAKPRRRTCLGVAPIIRRNVRVKCAASEKPAAYAASATDVPRASSRAPHCKRSQRTYGRRGTPTDAVNRCMNREAESPTLAATASNDTASSFASLLGSDRKTRLIRWSSGGGRRSRTSVCLTQGSTRAAVNDAGSHCARHWAIVPGGIGARSDSARALKAAPSSLSASTNEIITSVPRGSRPPV